MCGASRSPPTVLPRFLSAEGITQSDYFHVLCSLFTLGRFRGVRDNFHFNFICRCFCAFTRSEIAVTTILFNGIMSTKNASDLVKKMLRGRHLMGLNSLNFIFILCSWFHLVSQLWKDPVCRWLVVYWWNMRLLRRLGIARWRLTSACFDTCATMSSRFADEHPPGTFSSQSFMSRWRLTSWHKTWQIGPQKIIVSICKFSRLDLLASRAAPETA